MAGLGAPRSRMSAGRIGELHDAVLALLHEIGYDALTMDAVAARARSSKATLYRHWTSKPTLVADTVRHRKPVILRELDTGSLRGDLREIARQVGRAGDDIDIARAVVPAMRAHQDLADAVQQTVIEPGLAVLRGVLDRAVARGEVPAHGAANRYFPHLIVGALLSRPLVEEREPTAAYLRNYFDAVLLPLLQPK